MAYIIMARAGTLTTIPIFKVGTDAAHTNHSNPLTVTTTANFNAASVGYATTFGVTLLASVFRNCPDLTSLPLVIEMTTQAVGTGSPTLVIRPVAFFMTVPNT